MYRLVAGVARPLVRLLFRPRASGLEHVPAAGFVVAANQLSNLDGFALAYALYPRQLRWMVRGATSTKSSPPAVRGFRADLVPRIRRRLCLPLLALVERRLRRFDRRRLEARTRLARHVASALAGVERLGERALGVPDWVFPVLTDDPQRLRAALRRAGFDTSAATTSIAAVPAPPDRPELASTRAESMLARVIFLPVYPELREDEVAALVDAVKRVMRR